MQIFVQLNTAGSATGPFMIYSDVDSFLYAYGVNITKVALLAGLYVTVPALTTSLKIRSNGTCTNSITLTLPLV